MTDEQLADLAKRAVDLGAKADKLQARRKEVLARITKEMERRNTKGIFTGGVQITYVAPESIVIDPKKLRRALKDSWSLVVSEVLDKDKLSAAVQAGEINGSVVDRCSTLKQGTPYVRVTLKAEE